MLSILIFDQHVVTRCGLKQILREECRDVAFGEAGTAAEALRKSSKRPWSLAILGLRMTGEGAFHLLCEVRRRSPKMRVLVFGMNRRGAERGAPGRHGDAFGAAGLARVLESRDLAEELAYYNSLNA